MTASSVSFRIDLRPSRKVSQLTVIAGDQTGDFARMKKYLPLLANLLSQVLFGFAYFFIRMGMAVVDQDSVKFLAFRFTTGFAVMSLLLLFGFRKVRYRHKPFCLILLCGLCNPMISQILETTSTSYAPTSQIALYNSLMPVVMLLFSAVINREYPTRRQLLFVLVTVAGVLVVNLADRSATGVTTLGMILILSTIVVISVNRVLVRRASGEFTSFEIIYLTTGMGAVTFSGLSLGSHLLQAPVGSFLSGLLRGDFLISVLYMGIGSCVIAFLLMTYASANLPFAVYASTCTLSTVVGILSGVFLLREVFLPIEAAGTAVILLGIVGISFSYDKEDTSGNRFRTGRGAQDEAAPTAQ